MLFISTIMISRLVGYNSRIDTGINMREKSPELEFGAETVRGIKVTENLPKLEIVLASTMRHDYNNLYVMILSSIMS